MSKIIIPDPKVILGTGIMEDLPHDPNAPIKLWSRVEKIRGLPGDIQKVGDKGTVIGSFSRIDQWCYYVFFDTQYESLTEHGILPIIVGIMGFKLKEIH